MKFVSVPGSEYSAHKGIFLSKMAAMSGLAYEAAQAGFTFSRGESLKNNNMKRDDIWPLGLSIKKGQFRRKDKKVHQSSAPYEAIETIVHIFEAL